MIGSGGDIDGDGQIDIGGAQNTIGMWGISLGGIISGDKVISINNAKIKNFSDIKNIVPRDPKKYSWTRKLLNLAKAKKKIEFSQQKIRKYLYRPFTYSNLYFDSELNEMQYKNALIFGNNDFNHYPNKVICIQIILILLKSL